MVIFVFRVGVGFSSEYLLSNINQYTSVAQFCYNDYSNYDAKILVYWFDDEHNRVMCSSEGYEHELNCNAEILNDFSVVRDTYRIDKQKLYGICVYEGFVCFFNLNGRASLIYSNNDKKPKYVMSPYDKYNIFLNKKKVCDNWYFICETETLCG